VRKAAQQREREKTNTCIENSSRSLTKLTEERDDLRDELELAYKHNENIAENYNQEMKSKEALAKELEDMNRERRLRLHRDNHRSEVDSIEHLRELPNLENTKTRWRWWKEER